jgi:F0F1-type ATP synthase assembly protein I
MRCRNIIYFLLLTILCVLTVPQQWTSVRAASPITDQQWKELTNDKAFRYAKEKEMKEIKDMSVSDNFISGLVAAIFAFFSTSFGKTLVWIILFGIIGYALAKIVISERAGFFRKSKQISDEEPPTYEVPTEDLMKTNWEEYLDRASKDGNMRLVIRYSYMLMLQLMQRRQIIHYRPDKTNYDYYFELNSTNHKYPFRQLTRQYEYAWYGNYPVSESAYKEYMQTFASLKSQLYRS